MNKLTFTNWYNKINYYINEILEISITDLPDNTFREDYDNGTNIFDMLKKIVRDTEWEDYFLEKIKTHKDFQNI